MSNRTLTEVLQLHSDTDRTYEHYEIARYWTLKRWAEQMGLNDAVRLLDQTLTEEKNTDEALTELADSMINEQAEAAE